MGVRWSVDSRLSQDDPVITLLAGAGISLSSSEIDKTGVEVTISATDVPPIYEQLTGASLTVTGNNFGLFSWTHAGGSNLTTLGTATDPLIVTAGLYLISVVYVITPAPAPASAVYARPWLGSPSTFSSDDWVIEGSGGPTGHTQTVLAVLPANQDIAAQMTNDDSGSRTYTASMTVAKLA